MNKFIPFIAICAVLTGCAEAEVNEWAEYEAACHENVHSAVKYQAEILTTTSDKVQVEGRHITRVVVEGRARLQNGFGAWANHRYRCTMLTRHTKDVVFFEGFR